MKNKYRNHKSSRFNIDANILSVLVYVPAYVVLFLSWYINIPEIVSWIISLLPLVIMYLDESPLVRFHSASSVVINFGLVLFINLFYLMLLGFQIHNSDWGSLLYGYANYFSILLIYILPAYCMVNAYKYMTTNIPLHKYFVDKLSNYNDYNKRLLIKGRR